MLSVLQQMLHSDKGEGVRQAVVKSLGILVSFIDDAEKFKQVDLLKSIIHVHICIFKCYLLHIVYSL